MTLRYLGLRAFAASFRTLYFVVPSAIAMIALCSTTAQAQNKFWVTASGGAFNSATNWSTSAGGASGAAPPAAGEIANFTLSSTYTAGLGSNVTNAGLKVANGNVTLDLGSFTYTITGVSGTAIGTTASQMGRLTIRDGILAVDTASDDITLGGPVSSTGFLTITTGGQLGNGTLDPDLVVGSAGTATFAIDDNGRADVAVMNVALAEGSTGTVSVTGPNAVLDASGAVNVGFGGTATMNLVNGGTLNSAGFVTVGYLLGANGTVTVSGGTASWHQGNSFVLAESGDGALTVQSAGVMSTAGNVIIGHQVTGVGAAIITGAESTWNIGGTITTVALNGTGNLAVASGGRLSTTGTTVIAANGGSQGSINVTGSGSRWTSGAISIAGVGDATLSITGGGTVNTTGNVAMGIAAAGTGKATVSGAGSTWNVTGSMSVAGAGTGTLTVENGGFLSATGALSLPDPAGTPNSTLNFHGGTIIAGGFSRSATSTLNWTDGTIIVNGGAFINGGANLTINGGDADDLPALRLSSGATSLAANLPNLTIGSNRKGAAIVSGGSSLATTTTSIGAQDGSQGELIVEGVNSVLSTTGDLGVGDTTTSAGGIGTVTLGVGGRVSAGGTLRLWNGATVNLNGGTLAFNTIAPNGGKVNFTTGKIQVNSDLVANDNVLNALVGPPKTLGLGRQIELPGRTLTLQSDLIVSGGSVSGRILVANPGVITRVATAGTVSFTNGITNLAGARMYVTDSFVDAGTTFTNNGELHLDGNAATVEANVLSNNGLVSGAGRVDSVITNNSAGQVRVAAGQRIEVRGNSGNNVNNGLIDIDAGQIEFLRPITNSNTNPSTGLIAARDATLRFLGGLTNNGSVTFTSGVSDVFGDILNSNTLSTPGRIVVTGGAQANFFDDVTNSNGVIQVSATGGLASTAVFLGSLSGTGVAGTGRVFIEGDMRPGFSPGPMAFGGEVTFGPLSTTEIEIAGTAPGAQFDRVTVADEATLAGSLDVSLLGGFRPAAGNGFQILTAGGGITGAFDNVTLPTLSGGLAWNPVSYAAQAVTLSVGGVLGDYNLNGTVDTADYVVWRNMLGSTGVTPFSGADGDGDGVVDNDDYAVWRANFGNTLLGSGSAEQKAGSIELGAAIAPGTVSQPPALPGVSERQAASDTTDVRTELPPESATVNLRSKAVDWIASLNRTNDSRGTDSTKDAAAILRSHAVARRDEALLAWLAGRTVVNRRSNHIEFSGAEGSESGENASDSLANSFDAIFAEIGTSPM